MISTTGKKSFIDLNDLDGKMNTKKIISNIGPGTVTIGNIPNLIVQPGNNKQYENKDDSYLLIKKLNGERKI